MLTHRSREGVGSEQRERERADDQRRESDDGSSAHAAEGCERCGIRCGAAAAALGRLKRGHSAGIRW